MLVIRETTSKLFNYLDWHVTLNQRCKVLEILTSLFIHTLPRCKDPTLAASYSSDENLNAKYVKIEDSSLHFNSQ